MDMVMRSKCNWQLEFLTKIVTSPHKDLDDQLCFVKRWNIFIVTSQIFLSLERVKVCLQLKVKSTCTGT